MGWEQFRWDREFKWDDIAAGFTNGDYVSSNNGASPLTCDRVQAQGWEQFTYSVVLLMGSRYLFWGAIGFWMGLLMLLYLAGGAGLPGLEAQKLWVRVSAGAERQDFSWSIAGNSAGQDPNVYSELKWRGVSGPTGRIEALWKPGGRWRVLAGGARVFMRSGSMTDTDYGLDNRFDPVYRQQFKVTAGYSYSGGAAVGYCLVCGDRFEVDAFYRIWV